MNVGAVDARRLARRVLGCGCWALAIVMAGASVRARANDAAPPRTGRSAAASPRPWLPEGGVAQCLFLSRTAIPMLAMGVRRIDDDPKMRGRRLLDLWKQPEESGPGVEPLARVPLFRPLYVYDRRTEGPATWYLLGDAYVGSPRGWADGRQLHVLESRYGYYFNNPSRLAPGVQLYESRSAAHAALMAQSREPPQSPLDGVVVAERLGLKRLKDEGWNPLVRNGVPPFVELAADRDSRELLARGLTDTTLTFPFPDDNRLLHLGAVAGGPVDVAELVKKKAEAAEQAGVSIAFVIDETVSMKKYFPEVAAFIDENLELDEGINIRAAVSWYSDIEKPADVSYDVRPLEQLNGNGVPPGDAETRKARMVKDVRGHSERVTKGYGAQSRELIYQGLIAAIQRAGFQSGENAMVFVIGDAADRTEGSGLATLQDALAGLLEQHKLQLAFVQVGDLGPDFANQATEFRNRLPANLRESVMVRGVGDSSLKNQLADLRTKMEERRARLLGEIAEMETRNQYSQPGPVLENQLHAAGIDRTDYDRQHLQFFAPAWGWLHHPKRATDGPQLREVVWIAEAEAAALLPALVVAVEGLRSTGRIDADAARRQLSSVLAERTGHTGAAAAIESAWESLPLEDRTLGRFLSDALGLRARNAILFHRGVADSRAEPTREAVSRLLESRTRMGMARQPGVNWVDAWKVLP
jgi:hypothetical protein